MTEGGIDAGSYDVSTKQVIAAVEGRDIRLDAASSQSHADVIACGVEALHADTGACGDDTTNTTDTDTTHTTEISEVVVDQLSRGLLAKIVPDLDAARTTLSGITENQRILIETVQQENAKFGECQALTDVMDTMEQARLYHGKLVNIKKTMLMLHDKTASLKKRAVRLQQQKQKEALQQEQARDRETELERQLTAQPAIRQSHLTGH